MNGGPQFSVQNTASNVDLGAQIAGHLLSRIYRFSAERLCRGISQTGTSTTLLPTAINLAEVLHVLQSSNPDSYAEFMGLVQEVLPQVKWVTVVPVENQQLRIDVWPIPKDRKRNDLTVPLDESGSGIGQVLAILYVAYGIEDPRVLLIDEPQSFLHPGAARKLIEVLRKFPQHQYVISTHSAGVISAANAEEILVLENDGIATNLRITNTSDKVAMQAFLGMLGTRLSDVYGMDRVLWVEGPTEELALPMLMSKMGMAATGTSIVSIRNTGDLVGKDKEKFFEIYNNVSGKASILPRQIGFVFDREDRNAEAMDEITRRGKGRAFFLPRRMFENYLLNVDAIVSVINNIEGFSTAKPITSQDLTDFIERVQKDNQFWKPKSVPENPSIEDRDINGAQFLKLLFESLSESRVTYDKTEHSVLLFRWIIEHDYDSLKELVAFFDQVLDSIKEQSWR
jgi:energy-coupling factor transporter ATP-binding protein EcfA2